MSVLIARELLSLLQEDVRVFYEAIRALKAATAGTTPSLSASTLRRAQSILEEVDELMTVKFNRHLTASSRARRITWIRIRRQVMKLRQGLQETRRALGEALSVDLL